MLGAAKAPLRNGNGVLEAVSSLTASVAMQVISEDVGLSLDKVEPTMLGTAKKVTISKDDTIILDGGGAKEAIQERSDQIREAIDNSSSDYDRCGCRVKGAAGVCRGAVS